MSIYSEKLRKLWDSTDRGKKLTTRDREFVHDAYWSAYKISDADERDTEISRVLEIICRSTDAEDMPILLDASTLDNQWVHRCDVAEALSYLPVEGPPLLKIMLERETHYCVRFWISRALIDLDDPFMHPFLEGPIPPNSSQFRRSLWIYGNFENGSLSKEQALGYMTKMLQDRKRREEWLRDHILRSDSTEN